MRSSALKCSSNNTYIQLSVLVQFRLDSAVVYRVTLSHTQCSTYGVDMKTEEFNLKFNTLIDDVKGIKQSVTKIDELVEGFVKLKAENKVLQKRIADLEEENDVNTKRLQEIEQYSRRNNLIITGIPKEPNENLRTKVTKLAEKLNVNVYEQDICTVHRLSNRGEAPAIVVKMNNRDKKNQIVKEGRRKQLKCRDIGYNSDERIYCSEHLTKENNDLLQAAKERLKATGFVKFVWPCEGRILVREDENARIIRIEDMNHLQEIEHSFREIDFQLGTGEESEGKEEETSGNEEEDQVETIGASQSETQKSQKVKKKRKSGRYGNSSQEKHGPRNQQAPITSYMTRRQQPNKSTKKNQPNGR